MRYALAFSLCTLAAVCQSQQKAGPELGPSPLIDRTRPAVYLAYKGSQSAFPNYAATPIDVILLELWNNTRWPIAYTGSPDEYGGSGWFYLVVTDDACHTPLYPAMGNFSDVVMLVSANPGQNVPIVVPAEQLSRGLAIEVRFEFTWEYGTHWPKGVAVQHSVQFGYSDLPLDMRKTFPLMETIPRPRSGCNPEPPPVRNPPLLEMPQPHFELPSFLSSPMIKPPAKRELVR